MANPLEQFYNDVIRIIDKQTGVSSGDFKANVSPGKIQTYDMAAQANEGDFIDRDLPNGKVERYEILESQYHQGLLVIKEHYTFIVRKTTAIRPSNSIKNVINLHGTNARVYQNSTDNSTNITHQKADEKIFAELRQFIEYNINFNSNLLSVLSELEANQGNDTYSRSYLKFMSIASDHITVLAPFLGALATLGVQH